MTGYPGGGYRNPSTNNEPLEFGNNSGNRMGPGAPEGLGAAAPPSSGPGAAPSDQRDRRPPSQERRERRPALLRAPPNDQGGPGGRRNGAGMDGAAGNGPGGAEYPQRRNEGGRRDRPARRDGAPLLGNAPMPAMQPGPMMAGGGQMPGVNNGMPAAQGMMAATGGDQMQMGNVWEMQQAGPGMMGYGMGGQMGGMYDMSMNADPNAAMMTQAGQYNFLPPGMQQPLYPQLPGTWMPDGNFLPIKEVITCAECVLYPPNPNARPPMTRERPPGCRTVFIGGLPENVTEEILRDVFQRCGEITTLRMSKKNFAHIRFELEVYVDYAIMLSGYRMRIRDQTDDANTGRIHCDYAQARDDTYEYECAQRALQREMRHRERMLQEMNRPPSPPPVSHYTHHEAQQLMEKIKEDGAFTESAQTLVSWLERGDCNKRTAANFFSMIQSTKSHIRRLLNEKGQVEEELTRVREECRVRQQQIIIQFGLVEQVFKAACEQKVWDHFSKPQRKSITLWKKQATQAKQMQIEDLSGEQAEEEMDLSDDDEQPAAKKKRKQTDNSMDLEEEDPSEPFRQQMEMYRNEADMKQEELDFKQKQMDIMRQTMQNVQQQLLMSKSREQTLEKQNRELREQNSKLAKPAKKKKPSAEGAADSKTDQADSGEGDKEKETKEDMEPTEEGAAGAESAEETEGSGGLLTVPLDGQDARIIGLASAFLNVHPEGASCDYIWSYLQQFPGYLSLTPRDVETVLTRYGRVFKESVSGVGAKMERKWLFIGYQPDKPVL